MRSDQAAQTLLLKVATDNTVDSALRADAVVGLAMSASGSTQVQGVLLSLIDQPNLCRDALRSLRSAAREPEIDA